MEISVPIENMEIPQTGLDNETRHTKSSGKAAKVTGIALHYEKEKRELAACWNSLKDTDYYTYQFYTDIEHPDESVIKQGIIAKCEATLSGLTRGQKTYVRVRGIGTKGLGPWSESAGLKVP